MREGITLACTDVKTVIIGRIRTKKIIRSG